MCDDLQTARGLILAVLISLALWALLLACLL